MPTLSTEAAAMDTQKRQIEAMFDNRQQRYVCEVCDRQYKTANGLQRHLKDQHQWNITENTGMNIPQQDCDHIAVYSASFMKCALLLRDTNDAYQMGMAIEFCSTPNYRCCCHVWETIASTSCGCSGLWPTAMLC